MIRLTRTIWVLRPSMLLVAGLFGPSVLLVPYAGFAAYRLTELALMHRKERHEPFQG